MQVFNTDMKNTALNKKIPHIQKPTEKLETK